jgi:nicotinamidase/pyrazinamidase
MTHTLPKAQTASFDVDPQKGFTPLCPDELPVAGGDTIVPALNHQATLARVRVGSKDAHPAGARWEATPAAPQFTPVGLPNVDIRWNRHCVTNTQGGRLLDGLPREIDYDFFVWKGIEPDLHPYGACYHDLAHRRSTGVIEWLKAQGITHVVVGGLATDYCVKTTALQLLGAGFKVYVNLEACRGIAPATITAALTEIETAGGVIVRDPALLVAR